MFFKQAICQNTKIIEINKNTIPQLYKTAAKHWTQLSAFPERYKSLFSNYIVANKIRVGEYNPEFKYYRVIAMHGDEMNQNGDYWRWGSLDSPDDPELLRYDKSLGMNVFSSFNGRGSFKNHNNDDVSNAVGLVLDTIPNHKEKSIEALVAVDKIKDPGLVRGIDMGYVKNVSMGCVKPGTLISLPDGNEIPIEEVTAGQQILTHLGKSCSVNNVQERHYKDKIYKIKVMGIQEPLFITNEHPIWTISKEQIECKRLNDKNLKCTPQDKTRKFCKYFDSKGEDTGKRCQYINKEYKFDFIETEKLKIDDWVAYPFSDTEETPKYANKDLARLMGYYLSDGWCLKTKKGKPAGLSFCINKHETEFIQEIVDLLNKLKSNDNAPIIKKGIGIRKEVVDINLFDQPLSNLIASLCGEYAKYKKFDQSVLYWKKELQLEIIGTFINGDGCSVLTKYHNGTVHLFSASSILIKQFYIMLLRNNIVPIVQKIVRDRKRKIKDGIQYQINIGNYYSEKLQNVSIKVKKPIKKGNYYVRRRFIYKNYLIAPITKIETENYDDVVYNFEVDEDNSYVANNIAVHNCLCGHSICSICGHKAYNENQYCEHITQMKAQTIFHEGEYKQVYEDNRQCCFIELSWVDVPADSGANLLEKVATSDPIELSDDAMIMYEALEKLIKDAGIITGNDAKDYVNLMRAIKNKAENEILQN
jgi:intein/homing endonuclease